MKKDCITIVLWLLIAAVYLVNAECMFDTLFEVHDYKFPVVGGIFIHILWGMKIERKVRHRQQFYSS